MRLEFVKAFVEITESIFVEVLGSEVVTGRISLENAPRVEGSVVTLIELNGDVMGKIFLQMEMPAAADIAKKMLARESVSRPLIASCIAELTSMAVGRAISWINDQACFIDMSPPIVTMETQWQPLSREVETLVFPLKTGCGEAILNISFVDLNYNPGKGLSSQH
jgi:CheY-specific phosphatase CheX